MTTYTYKEYAERCKNITEYDKGRHDFIYDAIIMVHDIIEKEILKSEENTIFLKNLSNRIYREFHRKQSEISCFPLDFAPEVNRADEECEELTKNYLRETHALREKYLNGMIK